MCERSGGVTRCGLRVSKAKRLLEAKRVFESTEEQSQRALLGWSFPLQHKGCVTLAASPLRLPLSFAALATTPS